MEEHPRTTTRSKTSIVAVLVIMAVAFAIGWRLVRRRRQ